MSSTCRDRTPLHDGREPPRRAPCELPAHAARGHRLALAVTGSLYCGCPLLERRVPPDWHTPRRPRRSRFDEMATNEYHFITHWRVRGDIHTVADILNDPLGLMRWWPAVYCDVRVIVPGDANGVGREVEVQTKGWLPYTLRWCFRVTDVPYPHGFTLQAQGDFVG